MALSVREYAISFLASDDYFFGGRKPDFEKINITEKKTYLYIIIYQPVKHQEGTPQERGMHMKFLMLVWNILLITLCSIVAHDICNVIFHSKYTFTHSLVLCFFDHARCYNVLIDR